MMDLRYFSNKEEMSRAVADYTSAQISKKINSGQHFTLALSGGTSPVRYYELLSEKSVDWSSVKILLVDERKVEQSHPDSNGGMIYDSLVSKIDIPEKNIIFPDTSITVPQDCAEEYEKRIQDELGSPKPELDLIALGIGPDGHTASLFPGVEFIPGENRLIISTKAPEQFSVADRITMSMDFINRGAMRAFVIAGKGKQDMVQRTMRGDKSIPAGYVKDDPCLVFTDFAIP